MGSRTRARARALQVLYAWELRGAVEELAAVDLVLDDSGERAVDDDARLYTDRLLAAVSEHRADVDSRIQAHAENWRLSRMTTVDRNILRIAATEMLYLDDIPLRVSVQEAVRLAEWFGTDDSRRFINGVLDALLRELEPQRLRDAR